MILLPRGVEGVYVGEAAIREAEERGEELSRCSALTVGGVRYAPVAWRAGVDVGRVLGNRAARRAAQRGRGRTRSLRHTVRA